MPDDNLHYMTASQKAALLIWRDKIEPVLALGGAWSTELMFWLAPLGFVYSGGQLRLPASKKSTRAAPWTNIERYFNDVHYCNLRNITVLNSTFLDLSVYNKSGYSALLVAYPRSCTYLYVISRLYGRVTKVLDDNDSYLKSNALGYNREAVVGGLLVLFSYFVIWGTKQWSTDTHWDFYAGSIKSGTVGPYTVTVNYCENGVIFGVTVVGPPQTQITDHQSVDADILIQDEEQTTITATELLSADHPFDLAADVALQGEATRELDADMALLGEAQTPIQVTEALQDEVQKTIAADELLAATHGFDLPASLRLISVPLVPIDADICILGQATKTFSAYMLLLPDSASEMLTDLEKYHIQAMRIKADPRSYKVYNSKTDTEVIP
ncbi:MAG: hypothetical protein WCW68_01570 [Methanothrix sp.]|jgi:hypothetical protein